LQEKSSAVKYETKPQQIEEEKKGEEKRRKKEKNERKLIVLQTKLEAVKEEIFFGKK